MNIADTLYIHISRFIFFLNVLFCCVCLWSDNENYSKILIVILKEETVQTKKNVQPANSKNKVQRQTARGRKKGGKQTDDNGSGGRVMFPANLFFNSFILAKVKD